MSYLHLPSLNLADINKGTISLWFRFSTDSVQKAMAHRASYNPPHVQAPAIFRGTIPLVTFGRKVMAEMYDAVGHVWTQTSGGATMTATTFDSVLIGEAPTEPSHLGLEVDNNGGVTLKMNFQMETRARVQGLMTQASNIYWAQPTPMHQYQMYQEVMDVSYVRTAVPEQFQIIPKFEVSTNEWHHLLVSFDLSTSTDVVAFKGSLGSEEEVLNATITGYSNLWYAFDDANKDGKDNMGEGWVPQDQNGIVPVSAKGAAFAYIPTQVPIDAVGNPIVTGEIYAPEYHWTASPLPTDGGSVGLPASAEYVETIYHCEMAEFQFFGNLVLDTSNVNNRRMFVDAGGKPVSPAAREKLLGPKPELLLHGNGNWQAGANTGTLGIQTVDGETTTLLDGQFHPLARINKYKPEPALS